MWLQFTAKRIALTMLAKDGKRKEVLIGEIMNSQQLGRFTIAEEFVRGYPDIVAKALQDMNFVPVRAEMIFYSGDIELDGISNRFNHLPKGLMIPEYRVEIFSNQAEGEEAEYSHVEVTKI